eukprot:TRINITY_DN20143_c0_g1_i1.p1 TRINITY_DN20143_c0_g1~~TRINITY_DN20143_c0_g1_i1.p1  ORF type:complete len:1079 (+),score=30.60 TRINITY_DN20143_c0_g1_i1:136-3372(+)
MSTVKCAYCAEAVKAAEQCEDGPKVYHTWCLAEKHGDICHGCKEPLLAGMYVSMGKKWHEECFKCRGCGELMSIDVANTYGNDKVYKAGYRISKVGAVSGIRSGGKKDIMFVVTGVDPHHPGCLVLSKRRSSVPIPQLTLPMSPTHSGTHSGYSGPGGLTSPTPSPNPTPRSARLSPANHKTDSYRVRKRSPVPLSLPQNTDQQQRELPSVLELDGAIWSINQAIGMAVCQQDATQRAKVKIGNWPEIKREAAALKLASGTGVLEVMGKILTRNNKALLLTAWKDGGDVFSKSADSAGQGLDEPFAKNIFSKLMKALARCRKLNLAHRYVTLENIILGSVKGPSYLFNFKLARRYHDSEKATDVVGGPVHISPEALQMLKGSSDGYDPFTADMWAAGVCLYQMLAGRDPKWAHKIPQGLTPGVAGFGEVPTERQIEKYSKLLGSGPGPVPRTVSDDAKSLLEWVLEPDSSKRATPTDALEHPWLASLAIKPTEGRKLVKLSDNTSLLLVVLSAGIGSLAVPRKQYMLSAIVIGGFAAMTARACEGNPLLLQNGGYIQRYTVAALVVLVGSCRLRTDGDDDGGSDGGDEVRRPPDTARSMCSKKESKVMKRETRSRSLLGIRRESLPLNIETRARGWTKAEVRRFPEGFDVNNEAFGVVKKTPRVRRPVETVDDGIPLEAGAFRKRCGSTVKSKKGRSPSIRNPASPKTPRTRKQDHLGSPQRTGKLNHDDTLLTLPDDDDDDDMMPLHRAKTDGVLNLEPPPIQTPVEKQPKGTEMFPGGELKVPTPRPPPLTALAPPPPPPPPPPPSQPRSPQSQTPPVQEQPAKPESPVSPQSPPQPQSQGSGSGGSGPVKRVPSPPSGGSGSPASPMTPRKTTATKLKNIKKSRSIRRDDTVKRVDPDLLSPPQPVEDSVAIEIQSDGSDDKGKPKGMRRMQSALPMPLLKLGGLGREGGLLTGRTTARTEIPLTARTRGTASSVGEKKKKARVSTGSPTRRPKQSPFAYHSAALRSEMNRSADRPAAGATQSIESYLQSVQRDLNNQQRSSSRPAGASPPQSPRKKTGGTRGIYEAVFGPNSNL